MSRYEPVRLLRADDDVSRFDCGDAQLDDWLHRRAVKAQTTRTARTYVVVDRSSGKLAGYFCLSSHAIAQGEVGGGRLSRNAPDPIPVILLGRLAVDTEYQGEHLGSALLKEAVLRAAAAADVIGARALLVHAANDRVVDFYAHYGFRAVPAQERTLFLPLEGLTAGR